MGKHQTVLTRRALVAVGLTLLSAGALSAAGVGTTAVAAAATSPGGAAPGVSATQISVGAISSRSGPLAGYFGGLSPGMIAYFKTLDAKGGINGRQIVLTANLDDGGSPTQFTQDAHLLIDQDHVFAVGVASAWFTPNYFVSTKTPTYGYNVSANWQTAPNLFAVGGSTQIYSAGFPTLAYFIKKVGAKSVAFVSYGPSIASSYDACSADAQGMRKAGFNVNFVDVSAQLGGSYSSDVQRMQQAGSQLVVTCMQASDNVTLARDVQQYGLKIKQYWLNGYDQSLLDQYAGLMQKVYVFNASSVPFGAANQAKYGTTYSGMQQYISAMKKYEPGYIYNGVAFSGWQSAALIAAGIRAAGPDVTQASVVSATNKITNFTAGGVSAPVNWSQGHVGYTEPICSSFVQVQGTQYVTVLGQGKQVLVCLGASVKNPVPVTPPKGTPGT
jgi:ABC-type branched-subunit amino acid transport system substrate-binding protein